MKTKEEKVQRQPAKRQQEKEDSHHVQPPVFDLTAKNTSSSPLPAQLKENMESMSGFNMDDVKVHSNSEAPAQLSAKAFAQGSDIHLGPGQEEHLPHEAWHVVQQKANRVQTTTNVGGQAINADPSLELEADQMGERASKQESFKEDKKGKGETSDVGIKAVQLKGQHDGAEIPDEEKQGQVRGELDPGRTTVPPPPSTGGPAAPIVVHTWDGAADSAGLITAEAQAKRQELVNELSTAMQAHLNAVMPDIRATATAPRIPISDLEGAGNAAKGEVDSRFGAYSAAAAGPTPNFTFKASGADQNLYDAYDPAQRSKAGAAIDPADLAGWISSTDSACQTAQGNHHFNQDVSGEQQNFFWNQILTPFVAANRADLEMYDTFGFAISADGIVMPTTLNNSFSTNQTGSDPSQATRATQWGAFQTLVHEYIHQLEHSNIHTAREDGDFNSRIIGEGMCELFTEKVLNAVLPSAPSNTSLIKKVEGGIYTPPTSAAMIGTHNSGSYAQYLAHAKKIEGLVGENAVKAAYFQGHVEFLGLDSDGQFMDASTVGSGILIPHGITTLSALATATGLTVQQLRDANVGLDNGDEIPIPVIRLDMPGCREHTVVTSRGAVEEAETITDIATQHQVSEGDLQQANPLVDFTTLTRDQKILIPV